MVIFFFQAEDGIRGIGVTRVQTCALPISSPTEIQFRYKKVSYKMFSFSTLLSAELPTETGKFQLLKNYVKTNFNKLQQSTQGSGYTIAFEVGWLIYNENQLAAESGYLIKQFKMTNRELTPWLQAYLQQNLYSFIKLKTEFMFQCLINDIDEWNYVHKEIQMRNHVFQ